MIKYYKIADLIVAMDSYGRIIEQACAYEISNPIEPVDITIRSNWVNCKGMHPNLSDSDGEYNYTGSNFYVQLLNFQGFLLHSSAVVVDGKAYLFTADSGTGKSTHTKLWLDIFGDQAYILNDDKPALRLIGDTWYAYGTPWSGKYDISVNARVPLGGIAVVERSEKNSIQQFSGSEAVFCIYSQTTRSRKRENQTILLQLLDKLITQVPIWKLKCNMDPEAAIVSYEAMSGKKYEKSL